MKWISVDSTLESQRGIPVWSRNPTLHKHLRKRLPKHVSQSICLEAWSTSPSLSRSRCEGRPDGSGWWTSRSRRRSRRWWVDACHPSSPVPSPKSPIFVQLRIQCFALELLYFDVIRVMVWDGMRTCTSIQVIFIEVASEYFCLSSANRQALWQATLFKSSPLRV